jgi:hypothetical protein
VTVKGGPSGGSTVTARVVARIGSTSAAAQAPQPAAPGRPRAWHRRSSSARSSAAVSVAPAPGTPASVAQASQTLVRRGSAVARTGPEPPVPAGHVTMRCGAPHVLQPLLTER